MWVGVCTGNPKADAFMYFVQTNTMLWKQVKMLFTQDSYKAQVILH